MEIWEPLATMTEKTVTPDGLIPIWSPKLGIEFNRFVARLPRSQQERLVSETHRILSGCVDPSLAVTEPRKNAGLVLGYVQSGKTSSFTAATALAHDNGYKLIIVVGGVSKILLNQTWQRLQQDLDLNDSDVVNRWTKLLNPKPGSEPAVQQVQNLLLSHASALRSGQNTVGPTPIIVVMKETSHLRNLNKLLSNLAGANKDQLNGLSALIIDDECHMATPNVAKEDEKSRIYELMGEMRSYLPHHSILQYTATPQANLLCELEDEFRSDFVRLLGHGPDYTGGSALFLEPPKGRSIMSIPQSEQAFAKAAGEDDECVPSLRRAMATYLLIAANDYHAKLLDGTHQFERFSMLVHADSTIGVHRVFQTWLTSLKSSWLSALQDPITSVDRIALMESEFRPAYDDLQQTSEQPLFPLDDLFGAPMERVLQFMHIWLVDGSKNGTKNPDFNISNYNVLNGGEMLGVGFTVPRLHVTHMLRSAGQGQMDTIQQRGRFFGYCGSWLDKIRVWLEDDVKYAFEGYVEEEEFLRRDLKDYDDNNKQLKGWKVRLRLNPNARPTRRNAIRREIKRFNTKDGWIEQRHWIANDSIKKSNSDLIEDFIAATGVFQSPSRQALQIQLADAQLRGGEPKTEHFHAVTDIEALRRLLVDFSVEARDRDNFNVGLETLDEILVNDQLNPHGQLSEVDVFLIAHGALPERRRRSINDVNHHIDLHQGRNNNYIGDSKVHSDRISLQIHTIDHGPSDDQITETEVTYIAVWLPTKPRLWAENWIQEA
jgi:hypothetical protein